MHNALMKICTDTNNRPEEFHHHPTATQSRWRRVRLYRELEGGGRRHYHSPALAGAAAVVAIARAAARPAAAVTLAAAAIALATAGGAVAVASARSIADAAAQPATPPSPLPPQTSPPQPVLRCQTILHCLSSTSVLPSILRFRPSHAAK